MGGRWGGWQRGEGEDGLGGGLVGGWSGEGTNGTRGQCEAEDLMRNRIIGSNKILREVGAIISEIPRSDVSPKKIPPPPRESQPSLRRQINVLT